MLRSNPDEDRIWVIKLRNDSEAAFKSLFDAYRDDVFMYALSFLKELALCRSPYSHNKTETV